MSPLLFGEDEQKILKHLNIDGDKLNHYMELFSQWIATQKHLPQNFNETCRKKFLIWAKLDFERAKQKFQKFCYNSITYKEFYCNRALTFEDDINKTLDCIYTYPMPKLTPEGYRVTVTKIYGDKLDVLVASRSFTTYMDFRIHKDVTVSGEVVMFDLEGLKPDHYAKIFDPMHMKFFRLGMENYPFITKNFLLINCQSQVEKEIGVMKTLLPRKIADRVVILSNPDDLKKYIPRECLPEDYGGTEKSLASFQLVWKKFWLNLKDFYEELEKYQPISAIPEEIKCCENEYGVGGSFRMLNID